MYPNMCMRSYSCLSDSQAVLVNEQMYRASVYYLISQLPYLISEELGGRFLHIDWILCFQQARPLS